MNPKISVIIPTFNEEQRIGDCIDSLKKQTLIPFEIIVVDDGSSDRTAEIVKSKKIKLIIQKHLGPGPARNMGAKIAKGEILVFVDSDMTFSPDFLDKLTLPIRQSKAIGTFSLNEEVANWDNIWSKCWNWNNGNPSRNRVRDNIHDKEDFRAILAQKFNESGGFAAIGYTDSRSLVSKLGVRPLAVNGARYYHYNPQSLKEVFIQARWIGRRKMRLGLIGQLINIILHSLPLSILNAIVTSIKFQETKFIIFKLIFDLGFTLGIIDRIVNKSTAR